MPARRKDRATLSDLLADDVRDYFLREGVPDQTPQSKARPKRNRRKNRDYAEEQTPLRDNSTSQKSNHSTPSSSSATPSTPSSLGSLRAGWNTPSSTSSTSSRQLFGEAKEEEGHSELKQNQSYPRQEEQPRGQFMSKRKSIDDQDHQNDNHNHTRDGSFSRLHRRHGSGSGSFQSRGSASSSRSKNRTAADAEFLRRYAEEKERANLRMKAARPTWGINREVNARANQLDVVDSFVAPNRPRPYHALANSPRPPTVAGSHRPGLASIGGDDWEEDDRIERKEKRKLERRLSRRLERHRRKTSSMGGESSIGTHDPSVVMQQQHQYQQQHFGQQPPPGNYGNENSSVRWNWNDRDQTMMPSQGSVTSGSLSYGVSPGNASSTLCYSTSSSQNQRPGELRWDPTSHTRVDSDSIGTFVRMGSNDGSSNNATNGEKKKTHVRPLSYLSASSSDGGISGGAHRNIDRKDELTIDPSLLDRQSSATNSSYGLSPSPQSSSVGAGRSSSRFSYQSKTDGSSLVGSSIVDSVSRGSGQFLMNGTNSSGRPYQQSPYYSRNEEESSDDSYDSDDSSDTSCTSDSYDGGSSGTESTASRKDTKSEGEGKTPEKVEWERVNYRDNQPKKVNFRSQVDVEIGTSREKEQLLSGRGSNYSSTQTFARKSHNGKRKTQRRRLGSPGTAPLRLDDAMEVLWEKIETSLLKLELLISNMPSLVGSLALAWGTLGVDWFKWYEETFDTCHPADYHSAACTFTEFPGCFACDTTSASYQFTLYFHYLCSTISFILAFFLIGKIMIAFPVVRDELANPTTAAPLGLLCMALEKCFGGNFGYIGMGITVLASAAQTVVAAWFIFLSVVYKTLPEPSWFPNTTGIGLAAAKVFLYSTTGGYFLCGFSISCFLLFYFVALYRIHASEKITAIVCWVQLSGPAVILYGFTIFSQPGSDADELALLEPGNREHFFRVHRKYYMPVINIFFACCMISMCSALYCLKTRWKSFREKEFSPAHVGFCAPLVSHANAMQAYRSSLNKFTLIPSDHLFKVALYRYWTLSLISGTILTLTLTWKFFKYLPVWCQIDVEDDEIPPEPEDTEITRLLQKGEAKDTMTQEYVSAAVLQANESGALVRVIRDGRMKYVRSRRMPSMGFDLVMNTSELMSERERLLASVKYAADPNTNSTRGSSFDDVTSSFTRGSENTRASSRRNRLNFMSFDASTIMRGDFH